MSSESVDEDVFRFGLPILFPQNFTKLTLQPRIVGVVDALEERALLLWLVPQLSQDLGHMLPASDIFRPLPGCFQRDS